MGWFLRATALDKLPQLWNICKGEMSFVGPRALVPEEIEANGREELIPLEKIPGYEKRHQVRPGLTGLAQIYADRDIPRKDKFKYDLLSQETEPLVGLAADRPLVLDHVSWEVGASRAEILG